MSLVLGTLLQEWEKHTSHMRLPPIAAVRVPQFIHQNLLSAQLKDAAGAGFWKILRPEGLTRLGFEATETDKLHGFYRWALTEKLVWATRPAPNKEVTVEQAVGRLSGASLSTGCLVLFVRGLFTQAVPPYRLLCVIGGMVMATAG